MNIDTLRQHFHHVPFQPVILCLPTGEAVTIRDPKRTLFSPSGRTLIIAQGERMIPVDVATVRLAIKMVD